MGKKQKIRTGTGDIVSTPGPLHRQIEKANLATQKYKTPKKKHGGWTAAGHIDPKLSSKIILEAHKQLEEEVKSATKAEQEEGEEGSAEEFDEQGEHLAQQSDELNAFISQIEEEEAVTGTKQNGTKLFEVIQRKKELHAKEDVHKADELHQLDPTVDKLYTEVGQLLEKYRSGKVPKAFKIIPSLLNWEQVLELTCPEKWTAAAMLQATKIFASTGTPTQCQKFYSLVLLPRIRDEIDEYKKLHFHMYQCLFKAMFKPAAFFKGFLLPLCRSGTCTLREAVVFGSVLRKISIPQMHAAAAMLSIAEMDYNSSNMHLLRILIGKNYTLPFRALDGLVFQFLKMRSHYDELPVSWHQCLLIFAQIYAKDLSSEQRDALIELTKLKTHHQLTSEIQKVLRSTNSRNEESEANVPDYAKEDEEMDI